MMNENKWIPMRARLNPATRRIEFPRMLCLPSGQLIPNPLSNVLESSDTNQEIEIPPCVRQEVDLHAYYNLETRQIKCRKVLKSRGSLMAGPVKWRNPLRDCLRGTDSYTSS